MGNLQSALETLRSEATRLRGHYETARSTASNIEDQVKRVEKAIAILLGESPTQKPKKKTSTSLTGEEVASLIELVLSKDGPLKEPELKVKVGELAKAEGRSRKGMHFGFNKAIKDSRFLWNGARWALKNKGK